MTNKSYIMADYELYDHDMNQIDHDMNQMKKHNLEEAHGLFFTTLANINRLKIIYSLRKQ